MKLSDSKRTARLASQVLAVIEWYRFSYLLDCREEDLAEDGFDLRHSEQDVEGLKDYGESPQRRVSQISWEKKLGIKTIEDRRAIEAAASIKCTKKQLEAIKLVLSGLTPEQIAERLKVGSQQAIQQRLDAAIRNLNS